MNGRTPLRAFRNCKKTNNAIKVFRSNGTVLELNGFYRTTKADFALYHLLIHDSNGVGKPFAFFIKEETTDAVSECLKIFTEVHKLKNFFYVEDN
jgi:hypothetical protein